MKLLILRCPRCNQALSPGQLDYIIQCPNCSAAVDILETGPALRQVTYAAPKRDGQWHWLPFWVYDAQVFILRRETQGGRSAEKEAQKYWSQPRRLYVPVWEQDLAEAHALANELLEDQPVFQPYPPPAAVPFQPVVLSSEDARKLLDLIIVSVEAERRDWMEDLEYKVELQGQQLWLLPAQRDGDGWKLEARGL